MKLHRRVAVVVVVVIAAAVGWTAFGNRSEPPDIVDVEVTLGSIGSQPHLQLFTLMPIAPRTPWWISRVPSGFKDLFSRGPHGAIGSTSGGILYEFQTKSDLIVCRVYYEDQSVQQIELAAGANSRSELEEIRSLLKKAYPSLRVKVIEHPRPNKPAHTTAGKVQI